MLLIKHIEHRILKWTLWIEPILAFGRFMLAFVFLLGQFMNFQAGEILGFSQDMQFQVNYTQISPVESRAYVFCII